MSTKIFKKKLTPADVLELPDGIYYIEILTSRPQGEFIEYGDVTGYYICKKADDFSTIAHIKNTPGVIGLKIFDRAEEEPYPTYLRPAVVAALDAAVPPADFPDSEIRGKSHTLSAKIIPRGTTIYKGVASLRPSPARADDVSFYTLDPKYALRYTVRRGIGGIYVFRTTRDCVAFRYTAPNLQVLLDILRTSRDAAAVTLFSRLFDLLCLGAADDILAKYIYWQYFYKLENPWPVNKHYSRARGGQTVNCPERQYGAKMDRVVSTFLLRVGAKIGFDCTFQNTEYSTLARRSLVESEIIFPRNSTAVVRDTTHPLDVTNWGLDSRVTSANIAAGSIDGYAAASRVYDYFLRSYGPVSLVLPRPQGVLRVGTYNVHGMDALDRDADPDFMPMIHRMLTESAIDVLFLEEFPTDMPGPPLAGYTFIRGNTAGIDAGRHYARITVAAYCKKSLSPRFKYVPFAGAYNRGKKGYLKIAAKFGGADLILLGCHLSIYVIDEELVRAREISTMFATGADIIMGDFNETIDRIGTDGAAAEYAHDTITADTTPYNKVDHVFAHRRHTIAGSHIHVTSMSDHLPLICDIIVGKK